MHPALELLTVSDTVLLRGKIGFDMGAGSQRISDAYQIMMRFPEDYPESPPVTYETGALSHHPSNIGSQTAVAVWVRLPKSAAVFWSTRACCGLSMNR